MSDVRLYPGRLVLKFICPKIQGGQALACDQAKIDAENKFSVESSFKYSACDTWMEGVDSSLTQEAKDNLKKQCDLDVCTSGCFHYAGVAGQQEIGECVAQCKAGKRFNNVCEYFITRNLSNEVLANLGCGEQLKGIANIEAMKQAEANKLQAFDLGKKLLAVLLLFIVLFIAYKYL